MTVTVADILRWDVSAIAGVFDVAYGRAQTMATFGENLDDVKQRLVDWQGAAGAAFSEEWGKVRTDIDAQQRESRAVASVVARAEHAIGDVVTRWRAIQDDAHRAQLTITPDAQVINPHPGDMSLEREFIREVQQAKLDTLMIDANSADEELATAIRAAVGDQALNDDRYRPVTAEQLRTMVPALSDQRAQEIVGPLNDAMRAGGMNTPQRQAAFISQVAVESDRFQTFEEYADGSQYEGRSDLGNTQPGDGPKFKGRGAIQVTGRYNYTQMSRDLGVDFVDHPELAATPQYAFKTALWYWTTHGGNTLADHGDIVKITEMVNGGHHALAERTAYYNSALQVLGQRDGV